MGWPIPVLPVYSRSLHPPHVWRWCFVLFLFMIVGFLVAGFFYGRDEITQIIIMGGAPAFLLWAIALGIVLFRHSVCLNEEKAWNEVRQEIHEEWEVWSRKQLAIVGNVVFSAEEDSVGCLLGDLCDIPAYPQKARCLSDNGRPPKQRLAQIDLMLEQQCPDYRHHLYTIYLACDDDSANVTYSEAIFAQWNLSPKSIESLDVLDEYYDQSLDSEIILILGCQLWSKQAQKYSEFITAQLITSAVFASKHKSSVIAGMARVMPATVETLSADLTMLQDYTRLKSQDIGGIWLSSVKHNVSTTLSIYAHERGLPLVLENPFHRIDHTFGPAGPLSPFIALALSTAGTHEQQTVQLSLCGWPDNTLSIYTLSPLLWK